jgi:hypothetical protein
VTLLIVNMMISTVRCLTARGLRLECLILCEAPLRGCLIARATTTTCTTAHIDNHLSANLTAITQFIESAVMGFHRSGCLPALSFVGAPSVSHDVHYHHCLVTFTSVEVDYLVLSRTLSGHCTLTNN